MRSGQSADLPIESVMGHLSGTGPVSTDHAPRLVLAIHQLLEVDRPEDAHRAIARGVQYLSGAEAVTVYDGGPGHLQRAFVIRADQARHDEEIEALLLADMQPLGPARSTLDDHADAALSARCRSLEAEQRHVQVRPLRANGAGVGAVAFHLGPGTRLDYGHIDVLRRFCESAGVALADAHGRERLRRLAYTDALTGIANRRAIADVIDGLRAARRHIAILFIDFDGLKAVNEAAGYEAGDDLIASVGRLLGAVSDDRHIPGRLGGDEFVVVVADATPEHAAIDAGRLAVALESIEVPDAARGLFRGASVGWAVAHDDESDADLLRRAAAEMREAKAQRKGLEERR
jgi:diguanylate cyclase (GGDEF)-like protein